MEFFLDFVKNNYFIIFSILVCVVFVLLLLLLIFGILFIPKRFNKYWCMLLEVLPSFIEKCEKDNITGSDNKLNYVISMACNYLSNITGLNLDVVIKRYYDFIGLEIEKILSTPQKKEVL